MKTKYLIKKILRKIYHFIGFISLFIIFLTPVKADTLINIQYGGSNPKSELWYLNNLDWVGWYDYPTHTLHECNSRESCYNQAINYYNQSNNEYYSMWLSIYPKSNQIYFNIQTFNFNQNDLMSQTVYSSGDIINRYRFYKSDNSSDINTAYILAGYSDPSYNNFYLHYDTNYNFINDGDYIFKGFYDNEGEENYNNMLQVHTGGSLPKIIDLMNYTSWSDYENNHLVGYTEVSLNNYEYVLLSLKNYNQTQPFQTNLQVKGQIGITPIYNYGQTSKDSVTGVQVQDRCNPSYSDYTFYSLYVLQTDLQNNVVYAVKSCSDNSSFKFDTNIFDITYVTSSNIDDPTVIINGNTYHTIPYSNLPSTATKNEQDNYIPGESNNIINATSDGLNSALKNASNWLSNTWATFTYFTSFVGQIFSSLPSELHAILISAFAITIMIGLLKHFTG